MKATVKERFNCAILKRVFEVGEKYPLEQLEEHRVEERVNLLSNPHPKTKKVYISVEQVEQKADEVPAEEKPKRTRRAPAKKDGE